MPAPGAGRFRAEISASTSVLADLVSADLSSGDDLTRPVATCPGWTMRQLATHVGRGQRWAAEIVATRSQVSIPFPEVPDGRLPDDPARRPGWLREGAARLAGALAAAGEEPVWALDETRPASFWARRMAHETAVHRADAQLAAGLRPVIDTDIAVDGIEEWLGFLTTPEPGQPDQRAAVLDGGRSVHVHATDDGVGADGEWLIRATPEEVAVERAHGKADVAVRGPASGLLLLLVRRLSAADAGAEVLGDPGLLAAWLAATPF